MTPPDLINGSFEIGGFLVTCLSIKKLHHDRLVRGVSFWQVLFFASWGYWNLFYYPHLEQWASTTAAALLALANTVWGCQLILWTLAEKFPNGEGYEP